MLRGENVLGGGMMGEREMGILTQACSSSAVDEIDVILMEVLGQ